MYHMNVPYEYHLCTIHTLQCTILYHCTTCTTGFVPLLYHLYHSCCIYVTSAMMDFAQNRGRIWWGASNMYQICDVCMPPYASNMISKAYYLTPTRGRRLGVKSTLGPNERCSRGHLALAAIGVAIFEMAHTRAS